MNDKALNLVSDSLSRHRQAVTPVERIAPTQQEIDELFDNRITPETDLPPMQPLFRMFDVPCFYRGELVADCGKAKSGKTFFLSILMAACLTEKALALERIEMKPLRVLWIDTEQSQQSTQEILRDRILPLAGVSPAENAESAEIINSQTSATSTISQRENLSAISAISAGHENESVRSVKSVCDLNNLLYAFNLRGLGFEKRGRMVEVAIRNIHPDIAIIDGIKDLMTDINDAVQATLLMEKLMRLAKDTNCCIVCVLHQNKAEQDRNMRGSIGTELTNKAFEVFQCNLIEETDTFKVTHTFSRKQKMKRKFYYCINGQGLPEACPDYHEQPRDPHTGRFLSKESVSSVSSVCDIDLRQLFSNAMEGRSQRPFSEVMAIALKKCGVADAKAYYAYLDQAIEQGIVRKEEHPETGATWIELLENALPF